MTLMRRTGFGLVILLGLTSAHAQGGTTHARNVEPAPAATALLETRLTLGVDATADLAEAQPVAATKLPGPRPCSFVPSRNAVKPKKNACRFV